MRLVVALLLFSALAVGEDWVHLRNGGLLKGKVVEETDDSVVLEMSAGKMRIPRARVRLIERNADSRAVGKVETRRDEWFLVLHRGKVTGWRHVVATQGPNVYQIEEHTVFFRPGAGDDVAIRRVETASRTGEPREFLLMESYGKQMEVTNGQVTPDGRLVVRVVKRGQPKTRTVAMPKGWRFALPAWSRFLDDAKPGESRKVMVLDPRRLRSVAMVLQRDDDTASPERTDPRPCRSISRADTVRRARALYRPGDGSLAVELNGRTLVAKRVTRERVQLAREIARAPQPLTIEEAHRYPFVRRPKKLTARHSRSGLRIKAPDAGWVPQSHDASHGLVLGFEKIALFASLEVFVYPLATKKQTVEQCLARALARVRLTARRFEVDKGSETARVGGLPALLVAARAHHRGEDLRCLVGVVRADDRYVVLVGAAPTRFWRWAEPDFRKFVETLDIVR